MKISAKEQDFRGWYYEAEENLHDRTLFRERARLKAVVGWR